MFRISACLGAAALATLLALPASADSVDVYQIGSSGGPCGASTAYDPAGNCIFGSATPTWTNFFSGAPGQTATLTILAEGIDLGEVDHVFVNGTDVGTLAQQSFAVLLYNLSNSTSFTGPKDLNGDPGDACVTGPTPVACDTQITKLTETVLDVTAFVHPGVNTIQVVVDPNNWVNEIDISTLTATAAVPEPSSMTLMLFGGGVLAYIRRRFI